MGPGALDAASSATGSVQMLGEEDTWEIAQTEDASDVHDEGSDASVVVWDDVPSVCS